MRFLFPLTLMFAFASANAAEITVDVRDGRGLAVSDAVVYAVPDGKKLPLARKSAVMDQKNRMFVPHVLPVQTGTAVTFPNSDDIHHQVYSFSAAKSFQLPLYKGTPARPVVFDKAGVVSLGCNIHDRMSAYIVVVDTPYFATVNHNGRGDLENVSEGKYLVHVWYPDMREEPTPVAISVNGTEQKQLTFVAR